MSTVFLFPFPARAPGPSGFLAPPHHSAGKPPRSWSRCHSRGAGTSFACKRALRGRPSSLAVPNAGQESR